MVNRNLYLKIIGSVSLIVLFALLGPVLLITVFILSFVCLCNYPVDNSVANLVDKRYKS